MGKKEKKVSKLIEEHFDLVEKTVKTSANAIKAFFNGDIEKAKADAIRVDRLEEQADDKRREIYEVLGEGAFLPILRGDIHALIGQIDSVAGLAEDLSDAALGERPDVPEDFHEELLQIVDITFNQCKKLKKAVLGFFLKPKLSKKELKKLIHEVAEDEKAIDEIEWNMTRKIFSSNLDLAKKLHLKRFLTYMTLISNKAEDVSDELSELIVKMNI